MFGKLYKSIYDGTLRGRAHELLVFTNFIACCDRGGIIDKHFRAIGDEVGLTVEEVKAAVKNLESPDPESRTPDEQGARIKRLDDHRAWGWKIVNYEKYRAIRNEEDRAEQNRRAQAAYRKRNKQSKPSSAHAEADAEADAIHGPEAGPFVLAFGVEIPESHRQPETVEALKKWWQYKSEIGQAYKQTGTTTTLAKLVAEFTNPNDLIQAINASIAASWKAVFPPSKHKSEPKQEKPPGWEPWHDSL